MGIETTGRPVSPAVHTPIRTVLQMILGHHVTAVVAAIARFDIPDHLSTGPSTATRLAGATGVDRAGMLRLLRTAVSLGLLDEPADETFAINALSECLRRGPHSLREIALAADEPIHWRSAAQLTEAVTRNRAVASDVVGMDTWQYRDAHPEGRLATSDRLVDIEAAVLPALQRDSALESCRRIVAIGDGQCRLLPALLRLAPGATGVIFDRPPVVDHARTVINALGLADRVTVVGGDFLQRVPPGGDLYVIKGVLHDCDDDSASWLLDSCYMAALPHSTLIAFEGFLPSGAAHDPVARLIDINSLLTVNGRERTIEEFEELFANAGYELTGAEPLPAVDFRPFVMLRGHRA
jgi:hypothetical protein